MPACVPINNNNVGDTSMDSPPTQSDSRFSKIISCLFLKKKTEVVDMTKNDSQTSVKKKKMAVDRSERSRRVLKMESMRAVPQAREGPGTSKPPSPGQNQMFLPSENPTASFLSYLDPSARRACADVMRSTSSVSHTRPVREAFADGKQIHTRNTNYRGQQVSENGRPGKIKRHQSVGNSSSENTDSPPELPPRGNRRVSTPHRPPVVVPGIMSSSDDDMGYNTDGEIGDLHDEMRRMNMNNNCQSRLNGHVGGRQREGTEHSGFLTDEGSISLSEGSNHDDEILAVSERPNNPSPDGKADPAGKSTVNDNNSGSKKSMEAVIDDLFQQTQSNIDTIYRNGLETMDIEETRPETATPETCMKRLEADLSISQPDEESKEDNVIKSVENSYVNRNNNRRSNSHSQTHSYQRNTAPDNPNLDSLLTEVSIWAKDRQNWLLDSGNDPTPETVTRDSSMASMTTDGRVIEQVTNSNNEKCNEWVGNTNKTLNYSQSEPKSNGILTGPKLFRSTLKNPNSRRVSFGNKDSTAENNLENSSQQKPETRKIQLPKKKHFGGVEIVDLAQEMDNGIKEVPSLDLVGPYPEPWTADMYASSTPVGDRYERSTINDNISEPDERRKLRDRSPESWLSSNGSCSNLLNKTNNDNKDDDSFEFSTTPATTPRSRTEESVDKVTATNIGKSHQIIRQTPKIHSPFNRSIEHKVTPRPKDINPVPTKPMLRNTQLKPLTVLRSVKPKGTMDSYPTLPGMKNFIYEDKGLKNIHEDMSTANPARPFSEIPLRPDLRNNDRNSSILAHSSSLREDLEQYGVSETITRPFSETLSSKRTDKIGVGPIMATKSKQTYARDVINAMERQRFKNNQEAYSHENEDGKHVDGSSNDKKDPDNGKKRHKVFTNSLIRGGYNYDKHSRLNTTEDKQSDVSTNKHSNIVTTSVNDLSFSIRDSTEHNSWRSIKPSTSPRTMQNNGETMYTSPGSPRDSGDLSTTNNVSVTRGSTSQSFNIKSPKNTDIKRGSVSKSFHNKYSSVQSHGLTVGHDMNPTTTPNVDKTASKFRQLRNRRDQEMDWLMRDAAETEV